MNIEEFRSYCLSKHGAIETFPFDETTLVFKVGGKMFALTDLEGDLSINLKCDPDKAIELREHFSCVKPGYHMHKAHWNTINIDGTVNDEVIKQWIDESYQLIVDSLPLKKRHELEQFNPG